jgi:hypothetical protein
VVAEDGVGSAGEYRGHPAPAGSEAGVANGVDPASDAVQPRLRGSALDLLGGVADRQQLSGGHHAVLFGCQGGEPNLT